MIFSKAPALPKNERGQALVETVISGIVFYGLVVFAISILCNFMVKNILTRWATKTSRCVATLENESECRARTQSELFRFFGIRNVIVDVQTVRGTIHSKLKAGFIGDRKIIVGEYMMYPWEYKRTK